MPKTKTYHTHRCEALELTARELERFWKKVRKLPNGCWEWTGNLDRWGYGFFWLRGENQHAHRIAYRAFVGAITKATLDHLCRNRACVNPSHLEPATQQENNLRGNSVSGVNARKTHCPKGHPYVPVAPEQYSGKTRLCKICHNELTRNRLARAHIHKCPCGRKFRCTGVRFVDGLLASLWPCPRWECSPCNRAAQKRWARTPVEGVGRILKTSPD